MGWSQMFLSCILFLIIKDVWSDNTNDYRHKRIVGGFPIANNYSQLQKIAVLEIYHLQGEDWLRHPTCFGTFIDLDGQHFIATSARCFFPSTFTVEQYYTYSYSSIHNYRVFLGVVRINYGHNDFSRMNRLGIRSTIWSHLVIVHLNLDLNNFRDDFNVAIVVITGECQTRLSVGLKNGHFDNVPSFHHISGQFGNDSPADHCEIVGFVTNSTDTLEILNRSGVRKAVSLSSADLLTLNNSHCSQMLAGINVGLEENIFCLSGSYHSCLEVFLSFNEFGTGVFCGFDWFGSISNLFQWDIGYGSGLQMQIATVTPRQHHMSFIRKAQREQTVGSCVTASMTGHKGRLSAATIGLTTGDKYNPNLPVDRISQ